MYRMSPSFSTGVASTPVSSATSRSAVSSARSPGPIRPFGRAQVPEEEETTASGIVLPDTAKEKPQRGRVLAVGPGPRDEDGDYIKMDVEEGDEIIFSKYGGTEIKVGGTEEVLLRESDVLAKVVGDRALANA